MIFSYCTDQENGSKIRLGKVEVLLVLNIFKTTGCEFLKIVGKTIRISSLREEQHLFDMQCLTSRVKIMVLTTGWQMY